MELQASGGGGIRTHGTAMRYTGFRDRFTDSATPNVDKDLRLIIPALAAHGQRATSNPAPDLAAVIDAWPTLPEPLRAGILAMVQAASGGQAAR